MNSNTSKAMAGGLLITVGLSLSACAPIVQTVNQSTSLNVSHIHELVTTLDGNLFVASHDGLFLLTGVDEVLPSVEGPIGGLVFDPMGFTIADGRAFASGHPGPTSPTSFGAPNLGLIVSSDLGASWENISLTGITDFHGLTISEVGADLRIYGIDPTKQSIQRSFDGGATWSDGSELIVRDIQAVGDLVYATTPDGLAISADRAETFEVDLDAPPLFLIAADRDGAIVGIDTDGIVWRRDIDQAWRKGGAVSASLQAIAVDGDRIFVADDRGISITEDLGLTWTVLVGQ